jgi:N-acetylmuramoyl-L-alanine amidase
VSRRLLLVGVTAAALAGALGGCAGAGDPDASVAADVVTQSVASTPSASPTPAVVAKPLLRKGALAGKVIVIDPGHNGGNFSHPKQIQKKVYAGYGLYKACNSTGTATNKGYSEAAYNYSVAVRLEKILKADGAKVVMTRHSNKGVGPCINKRAAIGNAAKADAVLSIHGDGNLSKGARGFHIIIAKKMHGGTKIQKASQKFANVLRTAFHKGTGMPFSTYTGGGKAETHRTDIGGLNLSKRVAVMIETGNMRSATDAKLMSSATFRQREAKALAAGLVSYLT